MAYNLEDEQNALSRGREVCRRFLKHIGHYILWEKYSINDVCIDFISEYNGEIVFVNFLMHFTTDDHFGNRINYEQFRDLSYLLARKNNIDRFIIYNELHIIVANDSEMILKYSKNIYRNIYLF